jgi:uncharacterized damage-inducible protein DinB
VGIKDAILPEFDHETGATRRLLERLPEGDLGWRPHERSYSMGELVTHLAQLPEWSAPILDQSSFDLETGISEPDRKPFESRSQALEAFDRAAAGARARLTRKTDAELTGTWTLTRGGHEMFSAPAISAFRAFIINHMIHHRGQLTVYLRLRDVPLPPIYGPTADEPM